MDIKTAMTIVENASSSPADRVLDALLNDDLSHGELYCEPDEDADDRIRLERIEVDDKGQGHGNRLMSHLCGLCDENGVTIVLEADAYDDGLTQAQLVGWYRRWGFAPAPGIASTSGAPVMARAPGTPRRS